MGLFSKNKDKDKTKSNTPPDKSRNEGKKKNLSGRSICCDNLSFAAKEAYKRLRTNVVFSFPNESKCRIIGITSAQPSEGKTVSSVNLAFSLAEFGHRVLLIDGDMRRSSAHSKLGIALSPGLSNLLVEISDVKSVINEIKLKNNVTFDVITGGDPPPNPSELLGSERMKTLLTSLAGVYDFIIVDLPPVGAVIDAIAIAKSIDGMIIVIREQFTTRFEVADCVEQLQLAGIKIIGFLNNGSLEGSGKKYKYKKYGRRYGFGYGYGKGYGYGYGYGYGSYYGGYGSYGNYGNYGNYGKENNGK